jgi:PAS domain S-box-containing protein
MWREAVRTSALAVGLVDVSTTRVVEISDRAAELLGTTPEQGIGVDYLSVTERPREAAETFRLVREGVLDGIKGKRRFHGRDGSMVELQVTGGVIRSSTPPDFGLWIAREVAEAEDRALGDEVVALALWSHAGAEFTGARITLDHRWRIAHVRPDAEPVLGRPPAELLGMSVVELTHPDDQAALLLAFAQSTTETSPHVVVRLRDQDRGWRTVRAVVCLQDGDGALPFSLGVAPAVEPETPDAGGASELAGHLRRIASQIEAASILTPLFEKAAAFGVPAAGRLSPRQWEIASRLVQGERVATIAVELYLSQSTVRNHLSAIFQKFGVHSQTELLALWRAGARGQTLTD